jgi:hypothetical protein
MNGWIVERLTKEDGTTRKSTTNAQNNVQAYQEVILHDNLNRRASHGDQLRSSRDDMGGGGHDLAFQKQGLCLAL